MWEITQKPWHVANPEKICISVRNSDTGDEMTFCITNIAANDSFGVPDTPENAEDQLLKHLQRLADLAFHKKQEDPDWDTIISKDLRNWLV
ncbi:hypothetical protein AAIA72_16060 [Hahella sp. SMD15-11]|uniref:DUF1488 family protein n=1 Tax=Thermohahella caldifontis TaxID=3142973 RepID=A0AB39UWA9_9GAMM